ncbi:AmiS/UreI transporter [Ferroglobus placidus DSM 10642]|uniref:AmiS/UreI transporter n=1 Tax=Ferroglobus placidus (strain DSM 10642 / AEDII12DO) TaxID=589924 RepID=D3S2P2_FERPA|nr:AmiS/UreI family transporter [Ferroglobus placidus]ADC64572.1 AmiS/UreI transporter [Ferroglobus placidus DSM 10642]
MGLEVLGAALLYVGFVLILNGLWLLNKVDAKDVAIMNLFTGIVTFSSSYYNLAVLKAPGAIAWAQGLLFSFTYLWVFFNIVRDISDQRALGWYCLLVAITAVISGALTPPTEIGLAVLKFLWFEWAALWFSFWVLLVHGKGVKPIAYFTIVSGILAYIPAFPYMLGIWGSF